MDKYIVRKNIRLNASTDVVWDALTNPEKTKEFFFHCRVFSDWKPGSPITFKGKMLFFFPIELSGNIIAAEPTKLLKYELRNSKSNTTSIVTDTLTSEGATTVLTIEDNVGDGDGARKRYDRSVKGWDKILRGLKTLVEKR